MKSFTDLEQSKKLAEILPLESADMSWNKEFDSGMWLINLVKYTSWIVPRYSYNKIEDRILPCWSLAALYHILPNTEHISTTLSRGGWKIEPIEYLDNWWCEYEDENHTKDFTVTADNAIDACVEMIIKLHEQKLL